MIIFNLIIHDHLLYWNIKTIYFRKYDVCNKAYKIEKYLYFLIYTFIKRELTLKYLYRLKYFLLAFRFLRGYHLISFIIKFQKNLLWISALSLFYRITYLPMLVNISWFYRRNFSIKIRIFFFPILSPKEIWGAQSALLLNLSLGERKKRWTTTFTRVLVRMWT